MPLKRKPPPPEAPKPRKISDSMKPIKFDLYCIKWFTVLIGIIITLIIL
jgi:hypothetical protein